MMGDHRSSSTSSSGRKPPPIYVLDDDEDNQEEIAVVDSSNGTSARRTVVDLTDEVEFVGTSTSRAAAASAASAAQQLSQYRSQAAESFVQFVGTTRSEPAAAAAAFYASDMSDGDYYPEEFVTAVRPRNRERRSSPSSTKKKPPKKKRKSESPPPPPPIEKGKSLHSVPTGFDALDMYYPHLKAGERTAVLHGLLPEGVSWTKKRMHEWRVAYDKKHPKATLWAMAAAFSDEITGGINNQNQKQKDSDGDKKMPARKQVKVKGGKENLTPTSIGDDYAGESRPIFPASTKKSKHGYGSDESDDDDVQERKPTPSVGPLSGDVIDTLHIYFNAHVGRVHHKARLDNIEPIDLDAEQDVGNKCGGALTCSICADTYDATATVPCSGEEELHFFCKPCFASYATVTVQSGPVQSITCPMPGCNSLFATADAKANLSEWDLLMIEHRETSRDRRVALAAKAVMHCECGAVAIITEEDVGNGRVVCPGENCGRGYCCKCGNDDHGTAPCPPPAETVQWLDKHSKECPNCKNRIEKNGGCDHMTCSPSAGGCGYEFWWSCGCKYGSHRPGCQKPGEQ